MSEAKEGAPQLTNLHLPKAGWSGAIPAGTVVYGWIDGVYWYYALRENTPAQVSALSDTEYDGRQRALDPTNGAHMFWVQGGNTPYPLDKADYEARFSAKDKELGL